MEPMPVGWAFAAIFWALVIGAVAVLAVPSLRKRWPLVSIVLGLLPAFLVGSLVWTYTLGGPT